MNEYYILDKGERLGPFSTRELQERPLEPGDVILLPSQTQGVPAYSMPEFSDYFKSEGIYYPTNQNTSGYLLRLPAYIIDCIVVALPLWLAARIFFPQLLFALQPDVTPGQSFQQMMEQATANVAKHATEMIVVQAVIFIVTVLYNAACESSQLRASVGKYVLGLAVVDGLGYSITFLQALKRNLGKVIYELAGIFIGFLAYVAYIRMVWSDRHQAFHDMFSGCYIVKKDR